MIGRARPVAPLPIRLIRIHAPGHPLVRRRRPRDQVLRIGAGAPSAIAVNPTQSLRGVLSPVVTPFTSDLRPDAARLARHCRWLLASDVGLAVFGTNSEGNSLTVAEKLALLDALVEAGIPAARMMPGTGTCALPDTVELTRRAVAHGCGGVLMLPPFYYKDVSDDGLFASYAEVIERVGDARLRVYLYHIPQVSRVPHRPRADRAPAPALSGHRRGHQGQLGRLEQHAGDARAVPAARLRRVLRQRDVPARDAARGRRRLHQRHRERESGRDCAAQPGMAGAGRRRAAGGARRRARGIPEVSDDPRAQGRRRALLRRRCVADRAAAARSPSPRISGGSCWKR